MNYTKVLWVAGVAVVASVIDLVYMFWMRSNTGGNFNKAGWNAGQFGSGSYNLMKMGKHVYSKTAPMQPGNYHGKGGFHK